MTGSLTAITVPETGIEPAPVSRARPPRVGVVDYRMGNLASVSKALQKVGAETYVSDDPEILGGADLLVLPGVGNFTAGMGHLRNLGLDTFVRYWASAHRPLAGICLGMQLLFEHSEEGDTTGLGVMEGTVVRLNGGVKVPHMGWNEVDGSGFFEIFSGKRFYFVHSYVCEPAGTPLDVATTSYGRPFVSGVRIGSMTAFQFHPEKSSADGLALLAAVVRSL